jgi:hypothetical protein
VKFQTPRLVNDHKGSKDNLETVFYSAVDGSETLVIKRNGLTVLTSEAGPGQPEPAMEILEYVGGVEAHFAVLGSTAFARDLIGHASTKPLAVSGGGKGPMCGKGDHKTGCRAGKFVLGASSLVSGALVGALVGGPVAIAIGAAYGVIGLAIDAIDCDRPGEFDKCEKQRCDCRDMTMSSTKTCEDEMASCCQSAGGRVIQWQGDTLCEG